MEKEIGRIKKSDKVDVVVRIDEFNGILGVTIREFVTREKYTGFTKSGIRVSMEKWPEFMRLLNKVEES